MERMSWYLRQSLPFTYRTRYRDDSGILHFCVWKMWLGRVFHKDDLIISG